MDNVNKKNWYDLPKEEQKKLKKEFNSKKRIVDLRILLYLISFIPAFIFIMLVIAWTKDFCDNEICTNNMVIFGILFIITFALALINSLFITKHQKAFSTWLKSKNIER